MNLTKKLALFVGCAVLAALSSQASPYVIGDTVWVAETGTSPGRNVSFYSTTLGTAAHPVTGLAGVTHLTVNGTAVLGFCADPFQVSSTAVLPYQVATLANTPVGNPMGATAALIVERLWALYYTSALGDANVAAGLQVAIWEAIGGTNFTVVGNDYNGLAYLAAATSSSITPADLVGLTNRTWQDYVVPQGVPDGGATVMLLGLGLLGLAATRKLKLSRS